MNVQKNPGGFWVVTVKRTSRNVLFADLWIGRHHSANNSYFY